MSRLSRVVAIAVCTMLLVGLVPLAAFASSGGQPNRAGYITVSLYDWVTREPISGTVVFSGTEAKSGHWVEFAVQVSASSPARVTLKPGFYYMDGYAPGYVEYGSTGMLVGGWSEHTCPIGMVPLDSTVAALTQ